jgi:hypothetical protein
MNKANKTPQQKDAYYAGCTAFNQGVSREDNPYWKVSRDQAGSHSSIMLVKNWFFGWDDAKSWKYINEGGENV